MRRSSYASVVSGNAGATSPTLQRSGFLSRTSNPSAPGTPNNNIAHQHSHNGMASSQDSSQAGHSRQNSHVNSTQLPQYSPYHDQSPTDQPEYEAYPEFLVPSYLRGSRHIDRLAEAFKNKTERERNGRPSNSGSLSASTSNVNLHRIIPSHRGMTHEIIERRSNQSEETLMCLPSRWNSMDRFPGIEVPGEGLEVKFNGSTRTADEGAAIRSDHPIPRECGIYYYEITVLSKGKDSQIAIGFSGPKVVLNRLPGWEPSSWAYHGDDGQSYGQSHTGKAYGQKFGYCDTIGCGVNFRTGEAFFTRNGNHMGTSCLVDFGTAFSGVKGANFYPAIGLKKPGEHVRANFGQSPFMYDIDGETRREKADVMNRVWSEDPSDLHPSGSKTLLMQHLASQYLAHEGYVETARALADDGRINNQLLNGNDDIPVELRHKEDKDAVTRQHIRAAILDGNIDKALKLTRSTYRDVLEKSPNIYFKLRCRKFIELIRRWTLAVSDSSSNHGDKSQSQVSSGNGQPASTNKSRVPVDDADGDTAMDDRPLDDEEVEVTYEIAKQQSPDGTPRSPNELMSEAMQYGQELRTEFKNDSREEVKQALEDTFALIAYSDARNSSLAPMLDTAGRMPVAEELNSAILKYEGKSSSSVLEKLYRQADALIGELSRDGSFGAAVINVKRDGMGE